MNGKENGPKLGCAQKGCCRHECNKFDSIQQIGPHNIHWLGHVGNAPLIILTVLYIQFGAIKHHLILALTCCAVAILSSKQCNEQQIADGKDRIGPTS